MTLSKVNAEVKSCYVSDAKNGAKKVATACEKEKNYACVVS
jgi:hypothetical protein